MSRVPVPAMVLGFAGLLPFLGGALLVMIPPNTVPRYGFTTSDAAGGQEILVRYGTIILAFMAGCLWGFASRHGRRPSWIELILSVVPAVGVFLLLGDDPGLNCSLLGFGFALLLGIDVIFARRVIVV